jgi:hypothetical protein
MQRVILSIIFLLTGLQTILAQPDETQHMLKFGIFGGAFYSNENDLKQLNTDVVKSLPFNVRTINDFPPYFSYGGYVLCVLSPKFSIGSSYQFYTTGSRLGAKDYSGIYSFDQIISAHSLGILTELMMIKSEKSVVYFETTVGFHLANWKMEENYNISGQEENSKEKLIAMKPFIYPGLKCSIPITSSFGIAVKAGYSFDLAGKFRPESNPKVKSNTKVSFSGPRLTIAFEYEL